MTEVLSSVDNTLKHFRQQQQKLPAHTTRALLLLCAFVAMFTNGLKVCMNSSSECELTSFCHNRKKSSLRKQDNIGQVWMDMDKALTGN